MVFYVPLISQQSCGSLNSHRPFGLVCPYQVFWLRILREFRWPPAGDSPRLPAHVLHGSRAGTAPCGSCYNRKSCCMTPETHGSRVLQTARSTGDMTRRRTISKVWRGILCWVVSWKRYIEEQQHSQKHLVQMMLSEKSHLQVEPACLQHAYLFVSFQRCVSLCLEILLSHCWPNNTCRTDFVTLRWSVFPQQPGTESQVRKKRGNCFISWPATPSASSGLQCGCVAEKRDGAQVHAAHADPSPVCARQLLIESVSMSDVVHIGVIPAVSWQHMKHFIDEGLPSARPICLSFLRRVKCCGNPLSHAGLSLLLKEHCCFFYF